MKQKLMYAILCIVMLCTGCSKQPVSQNMRQEQKEEEIKIEIPDTFYKEEGNLVIDLELEVPEELYLKKTTAVKAELGQYAQAVKDIYMPGEDYVYVEHGEKEGYLDNEGEGCVLYEWHGPDSDVLPPSLSVSNRSISGNFYKMSEELSFPEKVSYSFRGDEYLSTYSAEAPYNADKYSKTKNLSFASQEDVLKKCIDSLEQVGLPVKEVQYECFSLEEDIMEQEFYDQPIDKYDTTTLQPEWKETDNGYYIFARQKLQGLPVFFENSFFSSLPENNIGRESCPIQILYTEEGLQTLQVCQIFEFSESEEQIDQLASFETVMDVLCTRYTEILTDSQFRIEKGGLFYYAKGNAKEGYEMIPAWIFQVVEDYSDANGTVSTVRSLFMINAQTGKEMEYE